MFDKKVIFDVPVASGGEKHAKCRYPSDEEFEAYRKKQRARIIDLGRRASTFEQVNDPQTAKELFDKIRQDPEGDSFDEYDADNCIGRLLAANTRGCTRNGEGFYIDLAVGPASQKVRHHLRMPTQRDKFEHDKAYAKSVWKHNQQEIRHSISHIGPLWDKLKIEAIGYAEDAVPLNHKEAAIHEVFAYMRNLDETSEIDDSEI